MRIAQICILYMYYRFMTSCTSVTYTELEQVQSQCTRGSYQVLRREDPSLFSPFQQHCELAMMCTFQDLAILWTTTTITQTHKSFYPSYTNYVLHNIIYRKSGIFHCKNIFVVDGSYEN